MRVLNFGDKEGREVVWLRAQICGISLRPAFHDAAAVPDIEITTYPDDFISVVPRIVADIPAAIGLRFRVDNSVSRCQPP